MKTKLILPLILSAAIFGCGNSNYSVNGSKEQSTPHGLAKVVNCIDATLLQTWNAMTQTSRDSKLFSVGLYYVGKNVGVECKPWVTNVVLAASGITLPNNTNNDRSWMSNDYCGNPCIGVNVVSRGTVSPSSMNGMDIIQMRWRCRYKDGSYSTGPHTAFLISKDSKNMTWLDCNYVGHDSVGTHSVCCDSFVKWTGPNSGGLNTGYTVYHVQPH
ncbi:MAG: hypothetical protein PHO56_00115 [Patescibacteria group bacterium]|nr:hypothetical protein [Patescibacteria group bacterium]